MYDCAARLLPVCAIKVLHLLLYFVIHPLHCSHTTPVIEPQGVPNNQRMRGRKQIDDVTYFLRRREQQWKAP